MGSTVSVHEEDLDHVVDGVPGIVRAMCCDRPFEAPERILLDDVDRVLVGRGAGEVVRTRGELRIGVADERMSADHVRLVRQHRHFVIEDRGSKNGTVINGRRLEATAELADGDVIETGHTFFVYRTRVPRGLPTTPSTIADTDVSRHLPLTTFVPGLARQFERLAKIARSTIPVVVLGETGTGKEVVANALHRLSGRAGALIALNCGAVPATLVESELFGARKGAFSGAIEDRPGLVRSADGGTLFLDEIGELALPAQVALLRVLQEQEVMAIGATKAVKVDVRVVAATHRPLDRLVDSNKFRADLFARLGGLTIRLPPLRERRDDLGLIVAGLLRRINADAERVRISRAAARMLFLYRFPHNIRELEKALGLGFAIARTDTGPIEIDVGGFPDELRLGVDARVSAVELARDDDDDEERKAHIIALLAQHHGRVADVARAMGKARMQIHRWIKKYDIDLESYRKA
ncbi:MAG: sigma 54-interacting transcriptional regulator [Deltaproteobacteria bacterium]|nr:sigma 54-interacting transcriptional regulator [Deltaproteobacteria bacterium]MDQ3296677.1 sigma 54-interacting transcriptional regulator [Myxococcota bacterium]